MEPNRYATPFTVLHAASLLSHKSRISKFQAALEQTVTSDSYVVDIGTGSGILAMLAAKAGAKKVTALEIDRGTAEYARKSIRKNGLDDTIEVINAHFSDFIPDEPADIVVCEMLSSILLIEQQIPAVIHANKHVRKDTGILLPSEVTISCAPVQSENLWNRFSFDELHFPSCPQTASLDDVKDMSDYKPIRTFDLNHVEEDMKVEEVIEFQVLDDGSIHGIIGMFEARLHRDITLNMNDGWRDLFLPIEQPIEVSKGNSLELSISFTPGEYDTLSVAFFLN
jgi:predicted RNA methylase